MFTYYDAHTKPATGPALDLVSELVARFRALPNIPWCWSWIQNFLGGFKETNTSEKLKGWIKIPITPIPHVEHYFIEGSPWPFTSVLSGVLVKEANSWVIPQEIWIEKVYVRPRNCWFFTPYDSYTHYSLRRIHNRWNLGRSQDSSDKNEEIHV